MSPPAPATTKKMKENARKAAQKKAKKAARKAPSPSLADQSGSSLAAAPASSAHSSYLFTPYASATSTPTPPPPFTSAPLPAALLAEPDDDDDKPGWEESKDAAWAQAQKNVCIRWVGEKREKLARAEEALAAGRGTNEEVEEAMVELSEEIDDAINRGCVMEELQEGRRRRVRLKSAKLRMD